MATLTQLGEPGDDELALQLGNMPTEAINPRTLELDTMSSLEIVTAMNEEDRRVADAVGRVRGAVAAAVTAIASRLARGGRMVYVGAGTSGRLGVLDAAECPPTFCSPQGQVIGVIAGGAPAMTAAIEGAEDDVGAGRRAIEDLAIDGDDAVVGIAASGRTPYVLGALQQARDRGALTVGLSCSPGAPLEKSCDLAITPDVGAEVLAGSTRLKAGTATKMVLNMLSTAVMVSLGRTYGNRMVDVQATNAKLRARALRMVSELTGLDGTRSRELLERCGGEAKTAIATHARGVAPDVARSLLQAAGGSLRRVLETR